MPLRTLRLALTFVTISLVVFPSTLAAQSTPEVRPTQQELTTTTAAGKDWITYGGALNNDRYSTLDQINAGNVASLKGAWMTRLHSGLGSKYKFEADPLVIDGVMYIPTGNDDIFALNAKTGQKLWEWNSDIPQQNDTVCCGWDNRGVAAGEGKIFAGLLDGSFVALDQKTGKIAWRVQLEDYHDGYSMTGAFRYYDGLVFAGMSGGEFGIRGRVYALDAKTGKEAWRFYTVPAPGEFGSDTWPSQTDPNPVFRDAYLRGGATVWQAPAIDPQLGMLYFTSGLATTCSPRRSWRSTTRPASTSGISRKSTTRSGTTTPPARRCSSTRCTTARCARGSSNRARPAGCTSSTAPTASH
jgi:quinohemoprotein ethanol dehydrogenase